SLVDLPLPFVLTGQSGWGRSLHFLAAWVCVVTGVIYVLLGCVRTLPRASAAGPIRSVVARRDAGRVRPSARHPVDAAGAAQLQRASAPLLFGGGVRPVSADDMDRARYVSGNHLRRSRPGDPPWRPAVRTHDPF